ncbi:MAG: glutathione S-transferase family protein [Gammaproteobacteria bacterium]
MLAGEVDNFHKLAGILDVRLAEGTWICGNAPTIADIVVAAPMHLHEWAELPLGEHPNVVRWMTKHLEPLPCWPATHVGEGFTVANAA